MTGDRGGPPRAELEQSVREAAEAAAPNALALAYTEPTRTGGGRLSVLVVADGAGGVRRLLRTRGGATMELLVVDGKLFESDARSSALLEAAAAMLLLPYVALAGEGYLARWERIYKRRKIEESLANLALEHPALSSELLIDPRYFVHDSLLRLSHIIPQASDLLRALDEDETRLEGYMEALRELERAGAVRIRDGLVAVDGDFVDSLLRRSVSVSSQLTRLQRQLHGLLRLGLNGVVDLLRPLLDRSIGGVLATAFGSSDLPRPDRFLHFPTATGLASLSESTSLEGLVARLEPSSRVGEARLRRFGGVLNEVYLLTYASDGETRRAIVKRYPNWVSLKWAPLALWTLGTRNFAVLGRSRMERECATTSLLSRSGVPVPKILHTSFQDRLLLKEYVEGENLIDTVKGIIRRGTSRDQEAALLRRAGETVAAVHGVGATLGDCKPENFIVTADGDPVIVDLEQGERGGNGAWDLAEFLYFSGHYARPLDPLAGVSEVARLFIEGYVGGGGSRRRVAEAAGLRYTKVFTPITLPQVIYAVAKACRREAG